MLKSHLFLASSAASCLITYGLLGACVGEVPSTGNASSDVIAASREAQALVPGLATWQITHDIDQPMRVIGRGVDGTTIADTRFGSEEIEFAVPALGAFARPDEGATEPVAMPAEARNLLSAMGRDLDAAQLASPDPTAFSISPACSLGWWNVFSNCSGTITACLAKQWSGCTLSGAGCVAAVLDMTEWCYGRGIPSCSEAGYGKYCCTGSRCGYNY
jgi:hypothetical protein